MSQYLLELKNLFSEQVKFIENISLQDEPIIDFLKKSHYRIINEAIPLLSSHEATQPPNTPGFSAACESCNTLLSHCADAFQRDVSTPPDVNPLVLNRWVEQIQKNLTYIKEIIDSLPSIPRKFCFRLILNLGTFITEKVYKKQVHDAFQNWAISLGAILDSIESENSNVPFTISINVISGEHTQNLFSSQMSEKIHILFHVTDNENDKILLDTEYDIHASAGNSGPVSTSIKGVWVDLAENVVKATAKKLEEVLGTRTWQSIIKSDKEIKEQAACAWLTCPRCGFHHLKIINADVLPCVNCGADPVTGQFFSSFVSLADAKKSKETGIGCLGAGIFLLVIAAGIDLLHKPLSKFWLYCVTAIFLLSVVISITHFVSAAKKTKTIKKSMKIDTESFKYPIAAEENARALKKANTSEK
jgi:hypothetical protein